MPIDYKRYPTNWKAEIVPRIIARAYNCCEFCGLENGAYVYSFRLAIRDGTRYKLKQVWVSNKSDAARMQFLPADKVKTVRVVLTVAHLDHDEENHNVSDDRLKALCQYCHLNYDAKEKFRRALAKGETNA